MRTTRTLSRLALIATMAAAVGCGDDDPTGPGNLSFPDWPGTIVTALCVRGTATVGDTKSGTIADTDCDSADIEPGEEGYFEIWRVRVAASTDVTFDASSTFDNFLSVVRVNSVTPTSADITVLGENDDRSQSNLNALVTVRLEPNIDYVVAISGFDYSETGPYTLAIR
jgi:hypothetical protein